MPTVCRCRFLAKTIRATKTANMMTNPETMPIVHASEYVDCNNWFWIGFAYSNTRSEDNSDTVAVVSVVSVSSVRSARVVSGLGTESVVGGEVVEMDGVVVEESWTVVGARVVVVIVGVVVVVLVVVVVVIIVVEEGSEFGVSSGEGWITVGTTSAPFLTSSSCFFNLPTSFSTWNTQSRR